MFVKIFLTLRTKIVVFFEKQQQRRILRIETRKKIFAFSYDDGDDDRPNLRNAVSSPRLPPILLLLVYKPLNGCIFNGDQLIRRPNRRNPCDGPKRLFISGRMVFDDVDGG